MLQQESMNFAQYDCSLDVLKGQSGLVSFFPMLTAQHHVSGNVAYLLLNPLLYC